MLSAEASLTGYERREDYRHSFYAPVEIEWGSAKLEARTENLSRGGMLLRMGDPLWLGAEFRAWLRVEEQEPIELDCVVKRAVPGVGIGVEFGDSQPAQLARLHKLIASLPH